MLSCGSMAAAPEIDWIRYKQVLKDLISTPVPFDGTSALLHDRVAQTVDDPKEWRPARSTTFFSSTRAEIEEGSIKRLSMSTFGLSREEEGIVVKGEKRKTNINIMQQLDAEKKLRTAFAVEEYSEESLGGLYIANEFSLEPNAADFEQHNSIHYSLNDKGMAKIVHSNIFIPEMDSTGGWTMQYNFAADEWKITNGKEATQILNEDQVRQLISLGFTMPEKVDITSAGGMHIDINIDGRQISIEVPSKYPRGDIFTSFIEGTPIVSPSLKIDGEEKVVDTSKKQIEEWNEQLSSMTVENDVIASSEKDKSVFRTLRIITDNAEAGKSSKVAWVKQEIVENGLEFGETNDIGLNVNLEYNSLENKEFKSEVVVESEKKYQFNRS